MLLRLILRDGHFKIDTFVTMMFKFEIRENIRRMKCETPNYSETTWL